MKLKIQEKAVWKNKVTVFQSCYVLQTANYHGEVEANLRVELADLLDFCVVVDTIKNFLPNMQVKRVFLGPVQQVC